ncbi:MAG: tRNA (guanosine(37)-N1)-methyltransferase TrmD [Spirochaetes bacterium]|nr:tRNA (guanosine(37)-N1)-methyltransferase TrmD [Spirochaetota bacterium]
MHFNIITLFPDFFKDPFNTSIIKKALEKRVISIDLINLRDFTTYNHRQCDDKPYGGGHGMVLMIEPVYNAITHIKKKHPDSKVIYLSPQGKVFNQEKAESFAKIKNITLLCGHYEGIDDRILDDLVDEEISIGDYILTGGETASLVFMEVVSRLIPGVVQKPQSVKTDSLSDGLLKYPQYTKPEEFKGSKVPEILLSGNHPKIKEWRKDQQIEVTKKKRPDLYRKFIKRGNQSE